MGVDHMMTPVRLMPAAGNITGAQFGKDGLVSMVPPSGMATQPTDSGATS
jgi:hypothetical protein